MRAKSAGFAMVVMIAALMWTGCETTGSGASPRSESAVRASSSDDERSERDALERQLAIAEMRLHQTRLELQAEEASSGTSVEIARAELEVAEAKRNQFQELDMPNRIARGELALQRARDSAAEAQEELAQLAIMYDEQDLEDQTAEFVISRGKRRAEQANASLAIQERELQALADHEVPRELRSIELEVARKQSAARKAESEAEAGRLQKQIAVMKAESELADLKEKLAKLDEKGHDG